MIPVLHSRHVRRLLRPGGTLVARDAEPRRVRPYPLRTRLARARPAAPPCPLHARVARPRGRAGPPRRSSLCHATIRRSATFPAARSSQPAVTRRIPPSSRSTGAAHVSWPPTCSARSGLPGPKRRSSWQRRASRGGGTDRRRRNPKSRDGRRRVNRDAEIAAIFTRLKAEVRSSAGRPPNEPDAAQRRFPPAPRRKRAWAVTAERPFEQPPTRRGARAVASPVKSVLRKLDALVRRAARGAAAHVQPRRSCARRRARRADRGTT